MRKATHQDPARQAQQTNRVRKLQTAAAAARRQARMLATIKANRTKRAEADAGRFMRDAQSGRVDSTPRPVAGLTFEITDRPAAARMLTLEAAAQELCGGTKDPMKNLKARIRKGTVETVDVDGQTFVKL